MSKINYEKVLDTLVKNHPHNMEAFRGIKDNITLSLETITTNHVWHVKEKLELLSIFGHHPEKIENEIHISGYGKKKVPYYIYLLYRGYYEGVEAVVQHSYKIEDVIIPIFMSYSSNSKRGDHNGEILRKTNNVIKHLIDSLPREKREELFRTYYLNEKDQLKSNYLLAQIIDFENIDLISYALEYVDNINLSFPWAVKTGNIDIVSMYLAKNANPLYECGDERINYQPAIEVAIANNLYNIYAKLIDHCKNPTYYSKLLEYASVVDLKNNDDKDYIKIKFANQNGELNAIKKEDRIFKDRVRHHNDLIECREAIIKDLWKLASSYENQDERLLDVLKFSIISVDLENFFRYAKTLIEKGIEYDIHDLIKVLLVNKSYENRAMFKDFIKYFTPLHEDLDLSYEIMKEIINNRYSLYYDMYDIGQATIHILKTVKEENRKSLPICPYVDNVKVLKQMLQLGYDLHAHVENQDNLLFASLKKWCYNNNLDGVCNYIIDNLDINVVNKENKNPFQVILDTYTSVLNYSQSMSNREEVLNRLNKTMKKLIKRCGDSVITDNMSYLKSFVEKYFKDGGYSDFYLKDLKDLILELASHDIAYDNSILSAIEFALVTLYNETDDKKKVPNINKYIEFYFTNLDHNKGLGDTTLYKQYEEVLAFIADNDIKDEKVFKELLNKLKAFDATIAEAKKFVKREIPKKRRDEFFKKYMLDQYNINYFDYPDVYLENIIKPLFGILKNQTDAKIKILKSLPHFNINHYFVDFDTQIAYYEYESSIYKEEDDTPVEIEGRFEPEHIPYCEKGTLLIEGYLTSYATLTNDLVLLKYLLSRKAKLPILDETGEDVSMKYVSSEEIKEFIESHAYTNTVDGLHNEDADYLQKLLKNSTKN